MIGNINDHPQYYYRTALKRNKNNVKCIIEKEIPTTSEIVKRNYVSRHDYS